MRRETHAHPGPDHLASLFPYMLPSGALPIPYSQIVAYYHDLHTTNDLAKRSAEEGRRFELSPSGLSLHYQGVYVGISHHPVADPSENSTDNNWASAKLSQPFAFDDTTSGELPPITTQYPRVTLPADTESGYGVRIGVQKSEGPFGPKSMTLDFRVNRDGAVLFSSDFPPSLYEYTEQALRNFKDGLYADEGRYRLCIESDIVPICRIRIDGGMPVFSAGFEQLMLVNSPIETLKHAFANTTKRKDDFGFHTPLAHYAELGYAMRVEDPFDWNIVDKVIVQNHGDKSTQEVADLKYTPLRRMHSIQETYANPHLGLVEVQVDVGCQVNSASLEYIPETVTEKLPDPYGVLRGAVHDSRDLLSNVREPTLRLDIALPTTTVTGKTTLGEPRSAPVSPLTSIPVLTHLHTFRLCLTHEQQLNS